MHEPHPARLAVEDDFQRNRLTVLFRLVLAIPHFIWFILWSIVATIVAILNWFATLFMGVYPVAFTEVMHASVGDLLKHVAVEKR